jgi:hypothetical protein
VIGGDDDKNNDNDLQAMLDTVIPTEENRRLLLPSSGPVAAN